MTGRMAAGIAFTLCNNIEQFAFRRRARRRQRDRERGADPAQLRLARLRQPRRHLGLFRPAGRIRAARLAQRQLRRAGSLPEIWSSGSTGAATNTSAHGRTNAERQDVLWEEDEAPADRRDHRDHHRACRGKRPTGWMGPYFAQSAVTLDLLKEAGYDYVLDWPADDQPILDAHPRRAHHVGALSAGGERHPGDGLAPAAGPRFRRHDPRPVRRDAAPVGEISAGVSRSRCIPS